MMFKNQQKQTKKTLKYIESSQQLIISLHQNVAPFFSGVYERYLFEVTPRLPLIKISHTEFIISYSFLEAFPNLGP